jgi:single-stranded DNA-binding protein
MQVKAQFTGNVTNDPELKTVGAKNTPLKELNIAINHDKKNRDTGEYERTGDTTWVTVKLWGEAANQEIGKGDLVEFDGTIVEKHFQRKDGTEGRRLESDYVASVVVKYSKNASVAAQPEPF